MSNYLPRTQKKRERQEWLENNLRRLVAKGASPAKLAVAAEEVRAARVRTIQADRQHCWAIGSTAKYDAEIAALLALPVDSILGEFGVGPAACEGSSPA
jgi:hypothetical protein